MSEGNPHACWCSFTCSPEGFKADNIANEMAYQIEDAKHHAYAEGDAHGYERGLRAVVAAKAPDRDWIADRLEDIGTMSYGECWRASEDFHKQLITHMAAQAGAGANRPQLGIEEGRLDKDGSPVPASTEPLREAVLQVITDRGSMDRTEGLCEDCESPGVFVDCDACVADRILSLLGRKEE